MIQHPRVLDVIDQYLLSEDEKYEAETSYGLSQPHEGQDISNVQNRNHFQAASTFYSLGEYPGYEHNRFWYNPAIEMDHLDGIPTAMTSANPGQTIQDTPPLHELFGDSSVYDTYQPQFGVGLPQGSLYVDAPFRPSTMPSAIVMYGNDMTEENIGNQALTQAASAYDPLKYDFSVEPSLSIPALSEKDGVIAYEHPIWGASHVTVESNDGQGSSAQPAFFSGREVVAKSGKARSAVSFVEPKSSRDLHAHLRCNTKLVKRAEVRKNDLQQEQSSPVRRIYEIKTEGAVAHANPEVQEGETEVNLFHDLH